MLHRLLRLLLCLCLVANTATGAWASVGMAMPVMASGAMPAAAMVSSVSTMHAAMPAAMPCHDATPPPTFAQLPDKATHAHAHDCCKLGSCDCLQHCSLALLTLPAVPAGQFGQLALPATLADGRSSPLPDQPVRPPIA
ncbi:CopL family metal-binding regulatory protein [Xanthomonas oryzae pv. oryzae]|uniref:CopL family metal-binding regulatory protein n=1 Tax=Xanthomonas oryzae TaxID=347 RepID=UPI000859A1C1|nr:CopL family metal-binding regulatory protein [Xanthomonas oryzae]AOS22028.1 copper homeostasis protein [Xanthomonas oryzae pv. oryzae]RBD58228.1 copper homeostasis protein [Xanthomonas oryzae pv. oryzae]RBE03994.1 copper homeostasis protein [Xanthomonas oryzae pv. oryzae]RBH47879.1 copper homeostasis protein [Xanthomonas oryzae pv. oryzae]UMA59488.1 copper homeostasis protein [Xanthomonas oryzae pv. oryzae]